MRKSLQFLGLFTDSDIQWLLSVGRVEELRAGETLVSAGEMAAAVFILIDGRFALVEPAGQRPERHLGSGEVIGEISAKPAGLTATAELPSRVLRVRRADLVDKCNQDERFAARFEGVVTALVSRRMRRVLSDKDALGPSQLEPSPDDSFELDAKMLDQIALAAKRLDWIRASR